MKLQKDLKWAIAIVEFASFTEVGNIGIGIYLYSDNWGKCVKAWQQEWSKSDKKNNNRSYNNRRVNRIKISIVIFEKYYLMKLYKN